MQILLGVIVATIVGVAAHYLLPGRDTRGAALAPLIGGATGAVVWTLFTWAGVGGDNLWIWVAAILAPVMVTVPVVVVLAAARTRRDAAERARLRIG